MIINVDGWLNLFDVVVLLVFVLVLVICVEGSSVLVLVVMVFVFVMVVLSVVVWVFVLLFDIMLVVQIYLGGIILVNGQFNYIDNFIKFNYIVNFIKFIGKIGVFGIKFGDLLVELVVQVVLDENLLVDISGIINLLQLVVFLDIKGKVDEVELILLVVYLCKYVGYLIILGKFNVDVYY